MSACNDEAHIFSVPVTAFDESLSERWCVCGGTYFRSSLYPASTPSFTEAIMLGSMAIARGWKSKPAEDPDKGTRS